jgi:hypothetical protein
MVREATITIATRLLRIVESKTIRNEKNTKSLSGSPLLIFKNLIAENSNIFDSSAAAVIIKVPIKIKRTSNSINPKAVSYEKTPKAIPTATVAVPPIIAAKVRFIFPESISK